MKRDKRQGTVKRDKATRDKLRGTRDKLRGTRDKLRGIRDDLRRGICAQGRCLLQGKDCGTQAVRNPLFKV